MLNRRNLIWLTWNLIFFQEYILVDASHNNRTQSLVSAESCVGQCAFGFASNLRHQLGGTDAMTLLNLNYNDMLITFSNATFFEGFCKLYYTFQFCYTSCPHSYMQELLARSASIVDHFCVYFYKDIYANFGCLSKLDRAVSKQCLQQCTPYHKAVNSLLHNFRHLAMNGDSTEAEKYLNESCEYVVCTMHCDLPVIAHMCGFNTANLVVNVTRKAFGSMKSMALDTGAVSRWPAVCAEIQTYRFPGAPSKIEETTRISTTTIGTTSESSPLFALAFTSKYDCILIISLIITSFGLL